MAMLHDLDMESADILNEFVQVHVTEKVWTVMISKTVLIVRALHVLKSAVAPLGDYC